MKYKKKVLFFLSAGGERRRGSTLSIRREREGLLAARIASLTRDERSSSFQPPPTPLFYLRTKAKETKERERGRKKKVIQQRQKGSRRSHWSDK